MEVQKHLVSSIALSEYIELLNQTLQNLSQVVLAISSLIGEVMSRKTYKVCGMSASTKSLQKKSITILLEKN